MEAFSPVQLAQFLKAVDHELASPARLIVVNIKWDEVKAGLVRAKDRGLSR